MMTATTTRCTSRSTGITTSASKTAYPRVVVLVVTVVGLLGVTTLPVVESVVESSKGEHVVVRGEEHELRRQLIAKTITTTTITSEGLQQWDTTCANSNTNASSSSSSSSENLLNSTDSLPMSSRSPSMPLNLTLLYNIYLTDDSPLATNYTATKDFVVSVGGYLHESIVDVGMSCNGANVSASRPNLSHYTVVGVTTSPDQYQIQDFGCSSSDINSTATTISNSPQLQAASATAIVACHQVIKPIHVTLMYATESGSAVGGSDNDNSNTTLRKHRIQDRRMNGSATATTTVPNDALVQLTGWLETAFHAVSLLVTNNASGGDGGAAYVVFQGFLDVAVDNLGGGLELPDSSGQLVSKQDSPDALDGSVLTQSSSKSVLGVDWGSYGLPIVLVGAVAMTIIVVVFVIQRRRHSKQCQEDVENELDTTPQMIDDDESIEHYVIKGSDFIVPTIEDRTQTILWLGSRKSNHRGNVSRVEENAERDNYCGIESIIMNLFCGKSK